MYFGWFFHGYGGQASLSFVYVHIYAIFNIKPTHNHVIFSPDVQLYTQQKKKIFGGSRPTGGQTSDLGAWSPFLSPLELPLGRRTVEAVFKN